MEILKQGNIDKRKKFTCENCGCIFIAEKDEYYREDSRLISKCPCCGMNVVNQK